MDFIWQHNLPNIRYGDLPIGALYVHNNQLWKKVYIDDDNNVAVGLSNDISNVSKHGNYISDDTMVRRVEVADKIVIRPYTIKP